MAGRSSLILMHFVTKEYSRYGECKVVIEGTSISSRHVMDMDVHVHVGCCCESVTHLPERRHRRPEA